MKKLETRIKNLNNALKNITKAVIAFEQNIDRTNDTETHIWRIKKSADALIKESFSQIQKQNTEEEFKKIVKKFKRK